ncbi:aldo/keto reductase [Lacipirellula parvula]|uniref:Aldo/keto reductase family protein n=1 Tax=Lacipirellula parvula TaxID=2650471 RepID=A0A5K7XB05_9BACT|nr:aldo/keto reductase [Lacipirellula parvula]BBO33920.1 aldo/keto reductase family protein [Lacipirellula parvula]
MEHRKLGNTGVVMPRLVFGTSSLGNLYEAVPAETKLAICREWFTQCPMPVAIDTAGKYGAGLALETIGRNLRELGIAPDAVVISNKLGWKRMPLQCAEPTFEPGVWAGLKHDAQQRISFAGMNECWEQGCELLGESYRPQLVSVHDPDEYLAAAASESERRRRFDDILDAYRALGELKQRGAVRAIGVGAKDWRVIQAIEAETPLDWVMLANSLTIYRHPPELIAWVASLAAKGIGVVNSAVFHAGFLVGGRYLDYRLPARTNAEDAAAFAWRERFHELCREWDMPPATACVQFALHLTGVAAVALNTSAPAKIAENVAAVETLLPTQFWLAACERGLISILPARMTDASD